MEDYMKKNLALVFGLIGIFILLFLVFIGPYLPFIKDISLQNIPLFTYSDGVLKVPPYEPSSDFLLGTDREGRDLLTLLIVGTKSTISFVFYVCLLRYLIAVPLGMLISNPIGSKYPRLIIKTWSKIASYVPSLFIILLIAKSPFMLFSDNNNIWMIILIAVIEIGRVSEFVSTEIDKIKSEDFVSSGIIIGNRFSGLVRRYFWPHLLPQIVINFSIDISRTIFLIGQLGIFSIFISQVIAWDQFEGLMIKNTSITWPVYLSNVIFDIRQAPWIPFWSSIFIAFSSFTFYLLSEGLRKKTQHPNG
jgi:peptide/nickel transport system permease protein